jgi:hypothetical protein
MVVRPPTFCDCMGTPELIPAKLRNIDRDVIIRDNKG